MSDWRSRATAVTPEATPAATTGWRDRATAVQIEEPGYVERIQQGFQTREQQMQQAADAYVAGEQSYPETAIQQGLAFASNVPDVLMTTAGQLTPEPIKQAGEAVFDVGKFLASNTIGRLPSIGGGTIREGLPQELQSIAEGDSRLARNIRAGGQALNIIPAGQTLAAGGKLATKTGAKIASKPLVQDYLKSTATTGAVRAERAAAKANIMGLTEIDDMARQAYAQADELGASFNPTQVANKFETKISESVPKALPSGKVTSEAKELIGHLDELSGNEGRSLSLAQVQDIDEALTQKINRMVDPKTGELDANGRKLYMLQDELRGIVDATDVAGNNALINGRQLWRARSMLRDLDAIAERASLSKNPHTVLQNGYKNLYLNKKRTRGWPTAAKELLKKAADPNVGTEFLDLVSSRLPAIIMGGGGNVPGAATAHLIGMGGRKAKESIIAGRGAKVQRSIVDETLENLRPVDVPPQQDVGQLLLASPEKITRLPMTEREIGISQALLRGGNPNRATIEGGPVIPPKR